MLSQVHASSSEPAEISACCKVSSTTLADMRSLSVTMPTSSSSRSSTGIALASASSIIIPTTGSGVSLQTDTTDRATYGMIPSSNSLSAITPRRSVTVTMPTSLPSLTTGNLLILWVFISLAALFTLASGVAVMGLLVMRIASCSSVGFFKRSERVTMPTSLPSFTTGTLETCWLFSIWRTSCLEPGTVAYATSLVITSFILVLIGITTTSIWYFSIGT